MGRINNFEGIEAWKIARMINQEVWSLIKNSDLKFDHALKDQMNKASGSIMDNIAEGYERDGNREFVHFLSISKASCGEVRSQLYRCLDRGYLDQKCFQRIYDLLIIESRKLKSFMNYLKTTDYNGTKFRK